MSFLKRINGFSISGLSFGLSLNLKTEADKNQLETSIPDLLKNEKYIIDFINKISEENFSPHKPHEFK